MKQRGFTLLEMMIAMAILCGALTWLVVGMSRNIQAENHAKLVTTATFLAREKMVDFEDDLYTKGFSEFTENPNCELDQKEFPRFSCKIIVDKVELPSAEQLQTVLSNAQQAKQTLQGGSTDTNVQAQAGSGSSSRRFCAAACRLATQRSCSSGATRSSRRRWERCSASSSG